VKGIEPEAREAAKQAARRAGVTLGAWLNQVIMETGTDEVGGTPASDATSTQTYASAAQAPQYTPAPPAPAPQTPTGDATADAMRQILARLEQSELRTFDLAQKLDQSVSLMAGRLGDTARPAPADASSAQLLDPLERKLNQLSSRLEAAERTRAQAPRPEENAGLHTLEKAVSSVIDHLDGSERRTEEALHEIREKLNLFSRKIEQSEEAARREEAEEHAQALQNNLVALSARLEKMEGGLSSFGPHIERAQTQAVETALKAMTEKADADNHKALLTTLQQKLDDVTHRLQRSEKRHEDVLKTFESSLTGIAKRLEDIDTTHKRTGEETLRKVETRLEDVSHQLRANEELAHEARRAVEEAMATVSASITNTESRGRNSIQALHTTLTKLGERMARVERAAKTASQAHTSFLAPAAPAANMGNGYPQNPMGFPIPNFDAPPIGGSFGMPAPRETFSAPSPFAPPPPAPVSAPIATAAPFEAPALAETREEEAEEEETPPPYADDDVVPQLATQSNYDDIPYEDQIEETTDEADPEPELVTPPTPQQAQARAAEDFLAAARRAAQAAAHGHTQSNNFATGFGAGIGSAAARYRAEEVETNTKRKWLVGGAFVLFCMLAVFGVARLMVTEPPVDTAPIIDETMPQGEEAPQTAPVILTPQTLAPEPELDPSQIEAVEPENQVQPAPTPAPKPQASSRPQATPAGQGTLTPAESATPAPSQPVASAPLGQSQAAGESNDPEAQYELAKQYMAGDTLPQDMAKAAQLYEKSAQQNFAPAQYRLAYLYEKGIGVAQNDKLSREWYEKAASQGVVKAMHNLGIIFAQGRGVTQDFVAASRWFAQAAEFGLGDSQYNLAILNERGLGIPQDLPTAYKWFSIAAKGGDKGAEQKRDELAGKLDAADLAQAKLAAENWSPRLPDAKANADVGMSAAPTVTGN